MNTTVSADAIDAIFRNAHTHYNWTQTPIPDSKLVELYELVKFAPTSSNCNPMRLVFVRTPEGKKRLEPALAPRNVEKVMTSPVTVIIAYDPDFFRHLPWLSPHSPAAGKIFAEDPAAAERAGFRNGAIQGGYLILAARSLGLDCGPLSGVKHDIVDREFLSESAFT
jgi:3-hydroxypropanoate dehydrogenase